MNSTPAPVARHAGLAAIVLANLLGGLSYPAQKLALDGLPPATVTLLRNLVALVLFVLVVRRRGARTAWTRADHLRVGLIGTCAYALPMWLGILGVELAGDTGASSASILILLEPVTIVLLAALFLGERIGRWQVLGILLGLAGALTIVLDGAALADLFAGPKLAGNLVLALHGVLWGLYTPLAKPLSARHDPFDLCLRATLVSVLALVPIALLEHAHWQAGPELVPALLWTLALGVTVSFGGVVLWLYALAHLQASRVAGFVFLQPLCGVLAGVLFLGERLSLPLLLGGALIVVGVALDVLRGARR